MGRLAVPQQRQRTHGFEVIFSFHREHLFLPELVEVSTSDGSRESIIYGYDQL